MSTLDMYLLFTEILPRLPVKSLMRFKCVSKSFKFEISSRNFSQLYLRYHSLSSGDDDRLILMGEKGILCYDLDFTTSMCSPTSTFNWNEGFVHVVGSCNGLLCIVVCKNGEHFSLLNPTTRISQDIHLPVDDSGTGDVGFAFDPENLDYKIVCISKKLHKSDTLITKVYSLNANSWTILEFPSPNYAVDGVASGTLIDHNLLHWKFWISSVSKHRIGCFDVCKNEWTYDVLLPHFYYDPNHNTTLCDIAVINENLCSSFRNLGDSCFEVWMMNEYGVQDSWVKFFSIIHESNYLPWAWGLTPIAQNRRSRRLLIRMLLSHRLLWCDSSGGGLTDVTFDGAQLVINLPVFMCKRSLVQLPNGHLFLDPFTN